MLYINSGTEGGRGTAVGKGEGIEKAEIVGTHQESTDSESYLRVVQEEQGVEITGYKKLEQEDDQEVRPVLMEI